MVNLRFLNDRLRVYVQNTTGTKLRSQPGYQLVAAFLGYEREADLHADDAADADPTDTYGAGVHRLTHAEILLVERDLVDRRIDEVLDGIHAKGVRALPDLPGTDDLIAILHRAIEEEAGRTIGLKVVRDDGQPWLDQVRDSLYADMTNELSGLMVDANEADFDLTAEDGAIDWDDKTMVLSCRGQLDGDVSATISFKAQAVYGRQGGRCGLSSGRVTAFGRLGYRDLGTSGFAELDEW